MNTPSFKQLLKNPVQMLAFGFGSGLSPKAPGTMATIIAVPLYLLFAQLSLPVYTAVVAAAVAVGIHLCGRTSRELGVADHQGIVWDEFVGYWIAMWAMPLDFMWILLGFVLFRFFDILKPWPIRWVDRNIHGGLGIMLDDVLAGLATCAALHLIHYWVY